MKITTKLTDTERETLLNLLLREKEGCHYVGAKQYYYKRIDKLISKLRDEEIVSNCCSTSVRADEGLQIDSNVLEGICLECHEHCVCVREGSD